MVIGTDTFEQYNVLIDITDVIRYWRGERQVQ